MYSLCKKHVNCAFLICSIRKKHCFDTLSYLYVITESSVTIEHLVEIILNIVEDESSVAVRLALLGVRKCLSPLLLGTHSPIGVEAVLKLLSIQNNPYWLVKVKYTRG